MRKGVTVYAQEKSSIYMIFYEMREKYFFDRFMAKIFFIN
jgi:hypothetical protein